MGQPEKGLSALRKLSRIIRDFNSDKTMDYALVQEAMGGICLTTGEVQQATSHFKKALGIYEVSPEDFAVAEFVDSSKLELQQIVRKGLDSLRKEME